MMKYFGTDGIRGRANEKLTPEMAYKVGRYLGYELAKKSGDKFLIGRDPRKSGQMLEAALASGLCASGCDVDLVGVVVTPLVSFLLENNGYVGGIMISASHNVYSDNGLKVMDAKGLKIDPFLQSKIEQYIDGEIEIPYRMDDRIGIINYREDLSKSYIDYLKAQFNGDLSKYKIAIDAANGSASRLAHLYEDFGLNVTAIHNQPDGLNINDNCGSTHAKTLQEFMHKKDFDLGVSFDGDGDRLMIIDNQGNIIDGDGIIYIISNYYKKYAELENDTVVVTVMSNIGLHKALNNNGIKTVITDVGDKNVFESMQNDNHIIGGEQSGHIILKKYSNMGDGFVVSLKLLSIMAKENKSISQLMQDLDIFPQLLVNVVVKNTKEILDSQKLKDVISNVSERLHGEGRVLVRASGTEPLIRVMVEAKTLDLCQGYVDEIVAVVNNKN
ncbi:MAG: phosphoglucosamine mutase [Erysipelothrix sp.]|nr:phosphoglucosamine mutase [Erysipelothrix sp.]